MIYKHKPIEVEAFQFINNAHMVRHITSALNINLSDYAFDVQPGDYIVKDGDGNIFTMTKREFKERYEVVYGN